ncbi:MAG: hypothetical protein KF800_19595 [Lysobacter sp.]|nr:hypothetical protein [Lysobacter sp.]
MKASGPWRTVALKELTRELGNSGLELPHASPSELPKPYQLATGDVRIPRIALPRGTLVVIGNLTLEEDIDARRVEGISNIIVTGDMQVRNAYVDAFLVVGGTLRAGTIVADSNWDGGLFTGAIEAETIVLKDCALDFLGKKKLVVKRLADLEKIKSAKKAVPELFAGGDEDEIDAYAFFASLSR